MFKYLYPGNTKSILFQKIPPLYSIGMWRKLESELKRGEDLDLGELEKLTPLDFDDGTAMIKGRVKVIDYVDSSTWPNLVIEKTYYGTEQEVYLTYGWHTFYDERIRSQYDGTFEFGALYPVLT